MPGKSQSHTDAVLNVLRGTDLTGVAPYVGLFSVAPADDNSAGTELAGNGYARQASSRSFRWYLRVIGISSRRCSSVEALSEMANLGRTGSRPSSSIFGMIPEVESVIRRGERPAA